MAIRGQNPDAWLSRWRQGCCPVHGVGFIDEKGATVAGAIAVMCPRDECPVRATQWPGKDASHALFGWRAGPDDIKRALSRGDIADDGRPGAHARSVRIAWPLEDDGSR
jgi:hypothetical protein